MSDRHDPATWHEAHHPHLELLDDHDCYALLRNENFGRVALCKGALPVILPIHYALLGRDPVFRTDLGTKLLAASAGNVLCLEIDRADPETHQGWSVLVTGRAEVLTDPEDVTRALALPLRPWVGSGDAFVRIEAALVSGRRIDPFHAGRTIHGRGER